MRTKAFPIPHLGRLVLTVCAITIVCALPACDPPTPPTPSNPPTPPSTATSIADAADLPAPITTPTGLTITQLKAAAGEPVPAEATVTIAFTAWIAGESEPFDSTEQRKRPLSFPLNAPGLIAGLREGITGMTVHSTRRLEIPAALAYGSVGRHPIPPDAGLIYEVTLLDWKPIPE